MTDQEALEIVIKLAKRKLTNTDDLVPNYDKAREAISKMEDITLDTGKPKTYREIWEKGGMFHIEDKNPDIKDYQIEIRGRVKGEHPLFGIRQIPIENEYMAITRYDVIASSFTEAIDMIREYENNGRREHELVRCTMRLA